jgi:hypothetical protein
MGGDGALGHGEADVGDVEHDDLGGTAAASV